MPDPFKVCTCGKHYTINQWRSLRRVGGVVDVESEYPANEGEEVVPPFELRTCRRCGSTISKVVPYEGGTVYPPRTRR